MPGADLRRQLEGKRQAGTEVTMELLSREYGWTPSQIREQSAQDIWQYVEIIGERARIEKARDIKSRRKHGPA